MRVVLTGGGTGGHTIPNIAIIEELKKHPHVEIKYIGSRNGTDQKLVEKTGVNFVGIHCGKLRRYFSWLNFVDVFKIPIGIFQVNKILKEFKPDVVFSKGGYVSLPTVIAAHFLGIPIITHESDVVPGLANKIAMRYAKIICISFEETKNHLKPRQLGKAVLTGNPVRESIFNGNIEEGYKFTGMNDFRPIILCMGGSQGAMQINKLIRESLPELLKKFQVVHIAGRGNIDIGVHADGYKQYEYLDENLKDVYAISGLVISRGGANSLAEIALLKKKAVIIPLSLNASRGDQVDNTRIFVRKFGWSMLSGAVNKSDFINAINMTYYNQTNINGNEIENGTKKIVDLIIKM